MRLPTADERFTLIYRLLEDCLLASFDLDNSGKRHKLTNLATLRQLNAFAGVLTK